jgi:SAM-dependent methyltransferase
MNRYHPLGENGGGPVAGNSRDNQAAENAGGAAAGKHAGDDPEALNQLYTATDDFGIGMLDPKDRRGRKNAYIDLLQKMAIQRCHTFSGGETVLEYACGAGRISAWLGGRTARVMAADHNLRLLELARAADPRESVCYLQVASGGFPFADGSFELATCIGLLRLLPEPEIGPVLTEFKRVLKPAGRFICIDKVYRERRPGHYSIGQYLDFFSAWGLAPIEVVPIRKGHWLPLYFIQFGLVPGAWLPRIARHELDKRSREKPSSRDYYQYLFHYRSMTGN